MSPSIHAQGHLAAATRDKLPRAPEHQTWRFNNPADVKPITGM
jgi:hypothetical protein